MYENENYIGDAAFYNDLKARINNIEEEFEIIVDWYIPKNHVFKGEIAEGLCITDGKKENFMTIEWSDDYSSFKFFNEDDEDYLVFKKK